MTETIFALATGAGRAALAVVRISGPGAASGLERLVGRPPRPRVASVRRLVDPVSRETLDEALVLFMPGPKSFTGEDVVELHLHGGRAVIAGVLEALAALGLRPAEPGEFTRRAFERGRLDLTEAEAIADLVDAESAAQRRQALAQLDGAASAAVEGWRSGLIEALAALEAAIDFPDEDLPEQVAGRARAPLERVHEEIARAAADLRGEKIREGYRIALVGAANAGKSSLMNRLVGRDAAIVTEVAGTTRDVIEQQVELAGYRVLIADTAGLRATEDRIEAEGVRRARAWASEADLRIWVVDAAAGEGAWRDAADVVRQGDFLVLNKTDLLAGADAGGAADMADAMELEPIETSAAEEGGVADLKAALERRITRDLSGASPPAATRLRHRRLLVEAASHPQRALAGDGRDPELMAEEVRLAARALEAMTGRIDAEAVLGEVFAAFCIGK
jgi:tRNA modification GTPase